MNIIECLSTMGYTTLPKEWYETINSWLSWYGGKTRFHRYRLYNGQKFVGCTRQTLGMAKKVCEDKADLLLNEKVSIDVTLGEAASGDLQSFVDTVLEQNNFWVRGNQLIELANASGTGAFVEYLDGMNIAIDYVPGPFIFPISWQNGRIIECAFASEQKTSGGVQVYVNLHLLRSGRYTVENYLFDEHGSALELPPGVLPVWHTGSTDPLFQIITPNIVNNVSIAEDAGATCPMGIAVYANAIDVLEGIDLIYDSYLNEFRLGRKRIFVDDTLLKVDTETGKPRLLFDTNDIVFHGIPMETDASTTKSPIQESNMELRAEQHEMALQSQLDILSEKCGFGKGYYKFDADDVQTATAVVSQNSQLYRKIKKDEIILYDALTKLVRSILYLGRKNAAADISINFDDSIIEDTNAIANRALLELQAGIIDSVEYFVRVYGLTEEAAIQKAKDIEKRKPAPEPPPDPFSEEDEE